jgi:hypothetical protein
MPPVSVAAAAGSMGSQLKGMRPMPACFALALDDGVGGVSVHAWRPTGCWPAFCRERASQGCD